MEAVPRRGRLDIPPVLNATSNGLPVRSSSGTPGRDSPLLAESMEQADRVSLMDGDKIWWGRLRLAMKAVRHWERRTGERDEVEPGSSIAKDDDGLTGHPVRTGAWYGLIVAVDHLGLVADLIRDGLTLRPSSIFTVTRAALLGASQAVWLLSGSREDRRCRALSIESDERKQHRGFVNDFARDDYVRDNQAPDFVAGLDKIGGAAHRRASVLARASQRTPI